MESKIMLAAGAILLAGCAAQPSEGELQARAEKMLREGFSHGNREMAARVATQDETQALCSEYASGLPAGVAARIEQSQRATIRYPAADGLLGNWREGEKIAQDGWGLRFTDTQSGRKNGGNCYACHQLSRAELSYGTVGPSLYNFGKLRGYGPEVQRYVWGKIYNSQAFAACSSMPRYGHQGILAPEQIRDLVALLLDPDSPVNK